jgi:coproporphyrinogen III oxidase-like Fe-S oxidoreductase
MKDAENVPDAGREPDATVQGALIQVTDNFFSKIQTIINHTRAIHQEFVHKSCLYINFYINAISRFNYIYINSFQELLIKNVNMYINLKSP